MATTTEAVYAGAELLDVELGRKTWDKQIDLDILALGNCRRCILGQLWGDYGTGVEELEVSLGEFDSNEYGFSTTDTNGHWGALTRIWKQVIRERVEGRRR